GVLALLARGDKRAALFDGSHWHQSAGLDALFHEQGDLLQKLLPARLDRPQRFALGEDGDGTVWASWENSVRYRDAGGWHWLGDAVAEQDDSLPAQADPVI